MKDENEFTVIICNKLRHFYEVQIRSFIVSFEEKVELLD